MPIFFNAFYQQFIIKDLSRAKKLYKQAMLRSECPKGAFQMLCQLQVQKLHLKSEID
jgi:hypothetical protein